MRDPPGHDKRRSILRVGAAPSVRPVSSGPRLRLLVRGAARGGAFRHFQAVFSGALASDRRVCATSRTWTYDYV